MHELLFCRQKALEDGDLRGYAAQLGLDVAAVDRDRISTARGPRSIGLAQLPDTVAGSAVLRSRESP